MGFEAKAVRPSGRDRFVVDEAGKVMPVPGDWVLVPSGDPGLTRRVKNGGPSWVMQEKKGRRTFSKGVWVEGSRVEVIRDTEPGTLSHVGHLLSLQRTHVRNRARPYASIGR